ncbi:TPA: hypothetical protein RUZ19_003553 [Vibrio cholerae]|uniref:Uncharacterized protein n=1 Tax=Vibrio cholerae TaxID=666 RepID=A0A544MUZ7_VIBCL|nr:hypothetical protein [Vibrio cholerae]EHD0099359.1 hypothetical protein [Vibrio vulnificus]EGQ8204510.1 hypothetical protein [Vibrio cholerae]EGQ9730916.1 hypothetical protein [Vibrio cholerae]EGR0144126.1 hypothetical protein [Vibrio cholerae]
MALDVCLCDAFT